MILESEELWVQILIAYLLTAWLWSAAALSMDAWAQTEAQQEQRHLLHGAALSSNMNTWMMEAMELLTPDIDVLLCVFTSSHMCMQMHVNMYVHACEEQRSISPRWTSSSIFLHFVYFFVETSSPQLARLAGLWDLPALLSSRRPVTSTGVPDSQHSAFLRTCKPRSLCLHSQLARSPMSNLSSPTLSFSWVNISVSPWNVSKNAYISTIPCKRLHFNGILSCSNFIWLPSPFTHELNYYKCGWFCNCNLCNVEVDRKPRL